MSDFDVLYKIVLVGDAAVGKTNLLAYFTHHGDDPVDPSGTASSFHSGRKPTIGVEFATKTIQHDDGTKIRVQVWDTAGQERYRAITSSHYRRAAGAMLVYDVSNRESFSNAMNVWLKELRDASCSASGSLSSIMLVGNKIDLVGSAAEIISEEQHEQACQQEQLFGQRTSAKSGVNVSDAFKELIMKVHERSKVKEASAEEAQKSIALNADRSGSARGMAGVKGCC